MRLSVLLSPNARKTGSPPPPSVWSAVGRGHEASMSVLGVQAVHTCECRYMCVSLWLSEAPVLILAAVLTLAEEWLPCKHHRHPPGHI